MKKFIMNKEIISYLIVGVLTTIISISTYFVFSTFILKSKSTMVVEINNIISWIISVMFAYIANKKYVFKSNRKGLKEVRDFISSRIFTLLVEIVLMYFLVLIINDLIAKVLIQFIIIILNYILSKKIVFKKTI